MIRKRWITFAYTTVTMTSMIITWRWLTLSITMRDNRPGCPEQVADHGHQRDPVESSPLELHQIMSKQYDVPHGLFRGVPYKKILYWNSAVTLPITKRNNNFGMGVGRDQYKLAGCPVWQCETSEDRTNLLQYDAILFNQRQWNGDDIPEVRSPHQRYIFFSYEPPLLEIEDEEYFWASMAGPFFNWTMTYRWDSDIVHPYAWIEPNGSIPLHPTEDDLQLLITESSSVNYAAGKMKMAVVFTTNCNQVTSGRKEMIEHLMSLIQVDSYGSCGNLTCGSQPVLDRTPEEDESCLQTAAQNYKFYLAFHNSLCLDYTPERFFNALRYNIIPIVMDSHNNHARTAPPHSFINALDFPSVRHLAEYLIKLDQNDTLYNQYFWWKRHFRIRNGNLFDGLHYRTFCSLCAVLHDPDPRPASHVYHDIKSWWKEKADCQSVHFDGMFNSEASSARPVEGSKGPYHPQLPSLVKWTKDVTEPNNHRIYFHETTGRRELNFRQTCAVESAAKKNPDRPIQLFMQADQLDRSTTPWLSVLGHYDNIAVILINETNYFADSPLNGWYESGRWRSSPYRHEHLADYIRMLSLLRGGGLYMDLDFITLKALDENVLWNFFPVQDEHSISLTQSVFHLEHGHWLSDTIVRRLGAEYDPNQWDKHGPSLVTQVLIDQCSFQRQDTSLDTNRCSSVQLLPHYFFFPISHHDWTQLFDVTNDRYPTLRHSYAVHAWNKLSSQSQPIFTNDSSNLYSLLAKNHCPLTFSAAHQLSVE